VLGLATQHKNIHIEKGKEKGEGEERGGTPLPFQVNRKCSRNP
jgi:hypothetical protein